MKKEKTNPYLSKKELAKLKKAKDALIEFQKELEEMKIKAEEDMKKNEIPIIFKENK